MKPALMVIGLLLFFGVGLAVKAWQYQSCRDDGMSAGTCLGIISR